MVVPPPIPGAAAAALTPSRPAAAPVVKTGGAEVTLQRLDLGTNTTADTGAVWKQVVAVIDAHRVSDVAFIAGAITVRVNGRMLQLAAPVGEDPGGLSDELYLAMLDKAVLREDIRAGLKSDPSIERDFASEIEGRRFRVNVYQERRGRAAAFRPLPDAIPTLADVGLTPELAAKIVGRDVGLVLVCGKTGSGKTTTLAALINLINERREQLIITLEDPIEFLFPNKMSRIAQREVGVDTKSFHSGIRGAMRENPDVILVGEIRDPETLKVALQAANTGHLVFGTLHTDRVSSTLLRMMNMVDEGEQKQIRDLMASVTHAIICQSLLPKKTGGRQVIREIMFGTPATEAIMRDGRDKAIRDAMQQGRDQGMNSWNQSMKDHQKSIDEKAYARNLDPE